MVPCTASGKCISTTQASALMRTVIGKIASGERHQAIMQSMAEGEHLALQIAGVFWRYIPPAG